MSLSERYYRCFFTGHRFLKNRDEIAIGIKNEVERLIKEQNVKEFITGGAIGFDMLAARVILRLKEIYDIRLKIYVPCIDHDIKWSEADRRMWRTVSEQADEVIYITDVPYTQGCMHARNRAMVNDAHFGIAYYNRPGSGTGVTLRFAKEMNCDVVNLFEI